MCFNDHACFIYLQYLGDINCPNTFYFMTLYFKIAFIVRWLNLVLKCGIYGLFNRYFNSPCHIRAQFQCPKVTIVSCLCYHCHPIRWPSGAEQVEAEESSLPCEFCGTLLPPDMLIQHQVSYSTGTMSSTSVSNNTHVCNKPSYLHVSELLCLGW